MSHTAAHGWPAQPIPRSHQAPWDDDQLGDGWLDAVVNLIPVAAQTYVGLEKVKLDKKAIEAQAAALKAAQTPIRPPSYSIPTQPSGYPGAYPGAMAYPAQPAAGLGAIPTWALVAAVGLGVYLFMSRRAA